MKTKLSSVLAMICAVALVIILPQSSFAAAQGCQTQKVRFHIDQISSRGGNALLEDNDSPMFNNWIAEGPYTIRNLTGSLIVIKNCVGSDGSVEQKKLEVPAKARMTLVGANARVGTLGIVPTNLGFNIHNFSGQTLSSVLEFSYYGGKVAATVSLMAGLNPNGSILVSKSGLFITDVESLISIGGAAVGFTISYEKLKISADTSSLSQADRELLSGAL